MLLRIYSYATLAYVGGGFGKGIHNILEPAAFGAPVITGPNYGKFQEAVDLTSLGGAFPINNFQELETVYRKIIQDPSPFSAIVKNYVEARTGATEAIMKKVFGV
jgi:3-deoxy-D-manno-octulosonic-acid transferase